MSALEKVGRFGPDSCWLVIKVDVNQLLGVRGFDIALKGFKLGAIHSGYIAVSITEHNEAIWK